MLLNENEKAFIDKRARFIRSWPPVGALLLILILGCGLWLFFTRPRLIDPFTVFTQLQQDAIPTATLMLMAGLLPIVMLLCMALMIALVLFCFAAFANERRLLAAIRRLRDPIGPGGV